ncbi:MAG: GAF domain-containing sensor histidine kinase [Nitrospirae bacterium]|nr:GAF domain-containing sensor histidine kinase [Nitrospirota bacterium]
MSEEKVPAECGIYGYCQSYNLQSIIEVSNAVGMGIQLDDMLRIISSNAADLMDAERGIVFLFDDSANDIWCYMATSADARDIPFPMDNGIARDVAKTRMITNIADAYNDARFNSELDVKAGYRTQSVLCCPIINYEGKLFGVLQVINKKDCGTFDGYDVKLIASLANHASIAIAKANLKDTVEDNKRELAEKQYHAAIGIAITQIIHGTKNILSSLKGSEYLVENALEKNDIDLLKKGWHSTRLCIARLSNLTYDLLNIARFNNIEFSKTELTYGSVNSLATEIIDMYQDSGSGTYCNDTVITVLGDLDESLPKTMFNYKAIHDAVMNLVSNAIDSCRDRQYADGQEGRVVIRTCFDRENNFVTIEVEDNGSGIKQEDMDKIFNLFYSTKLSKGNGLGLPVTRKAVEEHGGKIDVSSEVGKGTTFRIKLPVVKR